MKRPALSGHDEAKAVTAETLADALSSTITKLNSSVNLIGSTFAKINKGGESLHHVRRQIRGVSRDVGGVHAAIMGKGDDSGLFPNSIEARATSAKDSVETIHQSITRAKSDTDGISSTIADIHKKVVGGIDADAMVDGVAQTSISTAVDSIHTTLEKVNIDAGTINSMIDNDVQYADRGGKFHNSIATNIHTLNTNIEHIAGVISNPGTGIVDSIGNVYNQMVAGYQHNDDQGNILHTPSILESVPTITGGLHAAANTTLKINQMLAGERGYRVDGEVYKSIHHNLTTANTQIDKVISRIGEISAESMAEDPTLANTISLATQQAAAIDTSLQKARQKAEPFLQDITTAADKIAQIPASVDTAVASVNALNGAATAIIGDIVKSSTDGLGVINTAISGFNVNDRIGTEILAIIGPAVQPAVDAINTFSGDLEKKVVEQTAPLGPIIEDATVLIDVVKGRAVKIDEAIKAATTADENIKTHIDLLIATLTQKFDKLAESISKPVTKAENPSSLHKNFKKIMTTMLEAKFKILTANLTSAIRIRKKVTAPTATPNSTDTTHLVKLMQAVDKKVDELTSVSLDKEKINTIIADTLLVPIEQIGIMDSRINALLHNMNYQLVSALLLDYTTILEEHPIILTWMDVDAKEIENYMGESSTTPQYTQASTALQHFISRNYGGISVAPTVIGAVLPYAVQFKKLLIIMRHFPWAFTCPSIDTFDILLSSFSNIKNETIRYIGHIKSKAEDAGKKNDKKIAKHPVARKHLETKLRAKRNLLDTATITLAKLRATPILYRKDMTDVEVCNAPTARQATIKKMEKKIQRRIKAVQATHIELNTHDKNHTRCLQDKQRLTQRVTIATNIMRACTIKDDDDESDDTESTDAGEEGEGGGGGESD